MKTIEGKPEVYYETGMEGVGWIVGGDNIDSLEFIENGDYVIIHEKESKKICYEGLVFFNPFMVYLCRLGKYRVSFYPVNGFPEGITPTEWEGFFKQNHIYTIKVIKNTVSENNLLKITKEKSRMWKVQYLAEKDLLFSSAVSMHAVKSEDFFNKDINPRTGFELVRGLITKGSGSINGEYLFFIIEDEKQLDFASENIIESSYPLKIEDFNTPDFTPEFSSDFIKNFSALCFDSKTLGHTDKKLINEINKMRPEFEKRFKNAVSQLPLSKKKTYSNNTLSKVHYLRCVKLPAEMSLLFI